MDLPPFTTSTTAEDTDILVETPKPESINFGEPPFDRLSNEFPMQSSLETAPMLSMVSKRVADEMYYDEIQPQPDRKRRKLGVEQQMKRHNYDILKAFFRMYFVLDAKSAVLKDAVFNLYSRKISEEYRIARNAMYRHMWTFFAGIGSSQSNYRDYIKGIKLITDQTQRALYIYDGYEKDLDLLQNSGVTKLFDFDETDLTKKSAEVVVIPDNPESSNDNNSIISHIEQLEAVARKLVTDLHELKQKIKAKEKES